MFTRGLDYKEIPGWNKIYNPSVFVKYQSVIIKRCKGKLGCCIFIFKIYYNNWNIFLTNGFTGSKHIACPLISANYWNKGNKTYIAIINYWYEGRSRISIKYVYIKNKIHGKIYGFEVEMLDDWTFMNDTGKVRLLISNKRTYAPKHIHYWQKRLLHPGMMCLFCDYFYFISPRGLRTGFLV